MHPVGFIYEDCTGMHGQQNIKNIKFTTVLFHKDRLFPYVVLIIRNSVENYILSLEALLLLSDRNELDKYWWYKSQEYSVHVLSVLWNIRQLLSFRQVVK